MAKVAYYAHPLSLYGTPQEHRDVETLTALGFEVLNPNAPEHDAGYRKDGMAHFRTLVRKADVFAFRAFQDAAIPAGIMHEIAEALKHNKPVIELPSAMLRRVLSVEQTRTALFEGGGR